MKVIFNKDSRSVTVRALNFRVNETPIAGPGSNLNTSFLRKSSGQVFFMKVIFAASHFCQKTVVRKLNLFHLYQLTDAHCTAGK